MAPGPAAIVARHRSTLKNKILNADVGGCTQSTPIRLMFLRVSATDSIMWPFGAGRTVQHTPICSLPRR
jgi:hypothetical protein